MIRFAALLLASACAVALAETPGASVEPAAAKRKSETLEFNVNWPSGLTLGEGKLTSVFDGSRWSFSMNVDAAIPAFAVAESAKSRATSEFCSIELEKEATRGTRVVSETTEFDGSKLTATRETKKGGKSEMRIAGCARDALTYIQFLRSELAAGRLPSSQPVYYGAAYSTRVQYSGSIRVVRNGQYVDADKLQATIKGPASEFTIELTFLRDAQRTPFQVQIPVTVGKFTVEFTQ